MSFRQFLKHLHDWIVICPFWCDPCTYVTIAGEKDAYCLLCGRKEPENENTKNKTKFYRN